MYVGTPRGAISMLGAGTTHMAARGGLDLEVFTRKLEPQLAPAYRLARLAGCSADEAADVVQEACLRAWKHRANLRGEFTPWFLKIVWNEARRPRWRWLLAGLPSPLQRGSPETVDDQVQLVLRSLPTRQRSALWLRYGHDVSTRDVARVLGMSEAGAKQLLFRARVAFREGMRTSEGA